MVQSLGWSNGGSSNDNNQPMQPFMSAAPNQFLQSFSQPSAPAPRMAPISAPTPQLGSNNIPFPLRVPGQAPTMMQQLQYANPNSIKMAPQPDSPILSAAKTFYGGVNDVGNLLGTAVGSVLPFGQSNIYSPQGRANLVKDIQNETYNPNTKQWAQSGQDAVNKAQNDIKSGNIEAMAGDLGSTLLNAASVVPIGAGANAAKTAIDVGANAGKDAIQGALKEVAKSGLIGGGFAGLSGAAGAMQNDASLPDVLKAGAANVPLGVALGAGLPLAAKGLQVGGAKVAGMAKDAAANSNMEAGFAKVPGGKAPVDPQAALKQEALKYKSADEFVNKMQRGRADYGVRSLRLNPIQNALDSHPYTLDKIPAELGDKVKGENPRLAQDKIDIYRVTPGGIDPGDFVWTSKADAERWIAKQPKGTVNGTIKKMTVDKSEYAPAPDADMQLNNRRGTFSNPNRKPSLNAFEGIYVPKHTQGLSLTDLYNQAHTPQPKPSDPTAELKAEALKYKSADEFAAKTNVHPDTAKVFIKSKFRDGGGYADVPIIRKEDNITLYQGGTGENRQFWTPNENYAKQFGNGKVQKKTGTFYQIDNGNRMTDVYVDAKPQLTDLYNQAHAEAKPTPKTQAIQKSLDKPNITPKPPEPSPQVAKTVKPKQVPQTPQSLETSLAPINKSQPRSVPTNLESPKNISYADSITPNTKTRGFVKSAQSSKLVSDEAKTGISGTYETKANKALQDSAAIRISKDPVKAHDFALNNKSDEGTATAIALAQQYRKAGQHDLEASLINDKARRLTEAGREVQAASLMDKLSPQGVVSSAAQTIQRYNETAKKPIPELTGAVAKQFGDKADAISKMADGRERNIAINQLKEDAANLIPSKLSDKVITTWKAGLLTSPRTTMRNIVGNAVHGIAETAKDPIASLNDKALALKTGNREMTATLKGTVSGTVKGAQSAKDIATLGFDPEASVAKYNVNHITWGNNKFEQGLKHYTNIVFRNMGAQDKVFYHSSFARSLYDQAGAEAINAGKKGDAAFIKGLVDNPSERMLTNATKDAQTAVFQNSNAGSRIASAIKKEAEKFPGVKPIVDVVMPFTGVPSSIAGQMIAYSPLGLVKGIAKDAKVFAGKVTKENLPDYQRQASQEVGRGVIGTGLLAIGSYLTAQGLMTGQPKDKAQSDQWQLEGKQANSVMVNGKWRSINSIGPEALILLAGGKFAQGNDAATTAANIGKDFTSQTFLAGVQQPLNALSNPVQYAGSYIPNQAASVIPNIVKDTAKSVDPFQRETNVSGNIGQSTVNALKNSIPGAGQDLPAKRDVLGNPMKQEPSGANAFVDLFNSKTPIKNTVVNELSRLSDVGQSATPSTLSNKQTIAGQKVNLTPQQLDQLEKDTGQPITQQFNQLMQTPEYKDASDQAKKAALDGIVTSVRASAKLGIANGTSGTPQSTQSGASSSLIDTAKLTNKAQLTLAKDSFDKSGKSYQVVGDTVLRRGADGTVTATPKIKYDYQVGTATLTQQKNAGDLDGWMKTAQSQVDSINKQLTDPSIDPLEKVTLENTRQSLIDSASKYQSYGGFTKAKSSSSGGSGSSSGSSASIKASANAVLAATKKTPTQKLPKAPTVRQATYRQVPISSGSKATATNKYAPIKVSAKSVKVGKDKSHKANANSSSNWVTFKNGTYRNVM